MNMLVLVVAEGLQACEVFRIAEQEAEESGQANVGECR